MSHPTWFKKRFFLDSSWWYNVQNQHCAKNESMFFGVGGGGGGGGGEGWWGRESHTCASTCKWKRRNCRNVTLSAIYSRVKWNWFCVVTESTWVTCIHWRQRTNFTAPGGIEVIINGPNLDLTRIWHDRRLPFSSLLGLLERQHVSFVLGLAAQWSHCLKHPAGANCQRSHFGVVREILQVNYWEVQLLIFSPSGLENW